MSPEEVKRLTKQSSDDFNWATSSKGLCMHYEGEVVAVSSRRVIGHGRDYKEALGDAEASQAPQSHPRHELTLIPISSYPIADTLEELEFNRKVLDRLRVRGNDSESA